MRTTKGALLAAAVAITVGIVLYALFAPRQVLTVTFLDVGDGLCAVVRSPAGRIVVVDCGTSSWRKPESVGSKLVAPYLRSLGANCIDLAVLTHPHADHLSGFASLFHGVPPKLVLDSGRVHPSPAYTEFLETVDSVGARYRRARAGQEIDLGDGVLLRVLSPSQGSIYEDLNNSSLVLRLTYGSSTVLLTGDAGEEAESRLFAAGAQVGCDVLQVGHHGSADSTSEKWVDAARPRIAVISCARNSQHGHPSTAVVERLQSAGARVFVTGRDGAIQVTSDGKTIRCRRFSPAQ